MRPLLSETSLGARATLLVLVLVAFAAGVWSNGLTLLGQAVAVFDGAPPDVVFDREIGRFLDAGTTGGPVTSVGLSAIGSAVAAASVLVWGGSVAGDRALGRAGTTGLVVAGAWLLLSAALYANAEAAILGVLLLALPGARHLLPTGGVAAEGLAAEDARTDRAPHGRAIGDAALILAVLLVAVAGDVGARAAGSAASDITGGGYSGSTGSETLPGDGSRVVDVLWAAAVVTAIALAAAGRSAVARRLSGATIVALVLLPAALQVYLLTDPVTYSLPLGAGVGWVGALAITVTVGHRVGLRLPGSRRRRGSDPSRSGSAAATG